MENNLAPQGLKQSHRLADKKRVCVERVVIMHIYSDCEIQDRKHGKGRTVSWTNFLCVPSFTKLK